MCINRVIVISFFVLITGLIGGCRKDKPEEENNPAITIGDKGVFITNEGNFQFGNARISYYSPATGAVNNNLFEDVNGRALGDVCQSMYIFNGKAYIVLNNSGNIEVVNAYSFASTASISGFNSPRYFMPVSNAKAYVSDLYAGQIAIVDLNAGSISGHISCPGWSEEMRLVYGKVFVTNQLRTSLYVVHAATDAIIDSINIGYGANSIIEDRYGKLWVLCSDLNNQHPAKLHRINPITHSIEQSFVFAEPHANPWRLKVNGSLDTLYYLNNHVFRMPIEAVSLPETPFINAGNRNFYGLGICPLTSEVYVSDAIDYVQQGVVFRYNSNGSQINYFTAGIIPGDFWFW